MSFLHLNGNSYEHLAYLHGKTLNGKISKGFLPELSTEFERLISLFKRNIKHKPKQFIVSTLLKLLQKSASRLAFLPENAFFEARGLSRAIDKDLNMIRKAMIYPELINILAIFLNKDYKSFGCTSFTTKTDNNFFYARNFDYPSKGLFEKYPLVIFAEPKNCLKYIFLTSAGLHTAGLTAVNEKGIICSINQITSKHFRLRGTPASCVANELIQKADSLVSAINIIKSFKFMSSWSFLIADTKTMESAVCEVSPKGIEIRYPQENILVSTNHYLTKLKENEININYSKILNTQTRFDYINQNLRANFPHLSSESIIDILSNKNLDKTESLFLTTAPVHNTQSTVFDTKNGKIYLSNSDTAPVCCGDFIELNYKQFFDVSFNFSQLTNEVKLIKRKNTNKRIETLKNHYNKAFNYNLIGDYESALNELLMCSEEDKQEIKYPLLTGFMAFKLEKFDLTIRALNDVLRGKPSDHEKSLAFLFLGRISDIRGAKDKALHHYQTALRYCQFPKVKSKIELAQKTPYKKENCSKVTPDFIFGDLFYF